MKRPWTPFAFIRSLRAISSRIFTVELLIVLTLYYPVYAHSVFLDPIFGTFPHTNYVFFAIITGYLLYRIYAGVSLPSAAVVAMVTFGLFCAYYAVTILWSPSTEYGLYKAVRLLTVIPLLFVVTVVVATDYDGDLRTRRIFEYILAGAVLIALVTFYARGLDHSLSNLIGVNYLMYSRVLGAGVIAALVFAMIAGTQRRALTFGGLAVLLVIAMFLTGGRGPLVSAVIVSIGLVAIRYHQTGQSFGWKSVIVGGVIGVLGIVVLAVVIGARTIERFASLLTLQDGSAATRLDLYWIAIESWINAPVFGHGIGSYSIVGDVGRHPYWPHNVILEVGVEAGLVGVILLAVPVVIALVQFINFTTYDDPSELLVIAFVSYMFINASLTADISGNRALFVAVAMMFVTDRTLRVCFSLEPIVMRMRNVLGTKRLVQEQRL